MLEPGGDWRCRLFRFRRCLHAGSRIDGLLRGAGAAEAPTNRYHGGGRTVGPPPAPSATGRGCDRAGHLLDADRPAPSLAPVPPAPDHDAAPATPGSRSTCRPPPPRRRDGPPSPAPRRSSAFRRPDGSSIRNNRENVSWLGIPFSSVMNSRSHGFQTHPKSSMSTHVRPPVSIDGSAIVSTSCRSWRLALPLRGSKRRFCPILFLDMPLLSQMRLPLPGGSRSRAGWAQHAARAGLKVNRRATRRRARSPPPSNRRNVAPAGRRAASADRPHPSRCRNRPRGRSSGPPRRCSRRRCR